VIEPAGVCASAGLNQTEDAKGGSHLSGLLQRNMITKLYLKANDFARGQTMAEYALILAAVAIVVFVGYQTMGTTITTLLSSVDTSL